MGLFWFARRRLADIKGLRGVKMEFDCSVVVRSITEYLEDELDGAMREAIDAHIRGCHRCRAVYDGVRNVIQLFADDDVLEIPVGYSERLHSRLTQELRG